MEYIHIDVIEDKDKHFFRSLKKVFTHKSYIILLLAFLFNSLAIQVNFFLFFLKLFSLIF